VFAYTLAVVRHVAGHDGVPKLAGLQAEICGKLFYREKLQGIAVAPVCGKLFYQSDGKRAFISP
jgi:hypothetical protein